MGHRLRVGEASVPAQPFSKYILDRIAEIEDNADATTTGERHAVGASQKVAQEFGWGDGERGVRRLYRYKNQIVEKTADSKMTRWLDTAAVWPRAVVEDACHRVHPDLFYRLYPEYLHERDAVTLEPDAWCPYCKEHVTPIDGLCPWCVCEHGHIFREVGVTDDGFACLACLKKERNARARASEARNKARKEAA